jgi:hypothetical protein
MSDLSWLNPHPMQSLCTLRDHCRQGSRNTHYQAGAGLDRSSTGWIAPACLAHSFNHLVGEREQLGRDVEAERLRGCGLYPAGPAAILHRPDPIMIVAEPSLVVELAKVKLPLWRSNS